MAPLLLLDRLARRYSRTPHEMAALGAVDLGLDIAAMLAGESAQAQGIEMIARGGGMVFPTHEV